MKLRPQLPFTVAIPKTVRMEFVQPINTIDLVMVQVPAGQTIPVLILYRFMPILVIP